MAFLSHEEQLALIRTEADRLQERLANVNSTDPSKQSWKRIVSDLIEAIKEHSQMSKALTDAVSLLAANVGKLLAQQTADPDVDPAVAKLNDLNAQITAKLAATGGGSATLQP